MQSTNISQFLERGIKDLNWLVANRPQLQNQYDEMFIAVLDEKVIAADKSVDKLLKTIEKNGLSPAEVVVEFISKVARIL